MQTPTTFDNDKRFLVHNWSQEDFSGTWGGAVTVIKAGETVEMPMSLAHHFTKHFVDREMCREGKESYLGSDIARQPYEERTISEVKGVRDNPALSTLKEKIKNETERVATKTKKIKTETNLVANKKEFEDLK